MYRNMDMSNIVDNEKPSPQVNTDLIYTKTHKCGIIVLGDKL